MLPDCRIFACAALVAVFANPASCQTADDPLTGFGIAANLAVAGFDPGSYADVFGVYRQPLMDYLKAKTAQQNAFSATFNTMLKGVENGRVDEQAGVSGSIGAAASAAEKAGITGLVTGALENGAMTQTFNQTLLTLRGNGEGLLRFLKGQPVLPMCLSATDNSCDPSPLNNLELTASLDVSKSDTQTVTGQNPVGGAQLGALLTSNKKQFSSASLRYAIVNSRDLRSPGYRKAWLDWYNKNRPALMTAGADLLRALDDVLNAAALTPVKGPTGQPVMDTAGRQLTVYNQWRLTAQSALMAAPRTESGVRVVLAQQLDLLEIELRKLIPDLDSKLQQVAGAYSRYFTLTQQGIELANMPMLTAEVTYSEPPLQPKIVDARVVFAWSRKGQGTVNPGTFTLNGGLSMYTDPQPKDTRGTTTYWRDAQFAAQFDRPLGGSNAPATLTIGVYVQYQLAPGILDVPGGTVAPVTGSPLPSNATELLTSKGTIAVAAASLTLHIPGSGVKVPIGISWSNRSQLATASEIRGHVGFDFDTHSLVLNSGH